MRCPATALDNDSVTIGEALEASAVSASDKPVDQSDAAAIQAAEVRATGNNEITPGGIGAEAQSAATLNARTMRDENKITLGDILSVTLFIFKASICLVYCFRCLTYLSYIILIGCNSKVAGR